MSSPQQEQPHTLWIGILLILAVLFIGLWARKFAVLLLLIISLGTLIGVIFYFLKVALSRGKANSIEGKIEKLQKECTSQIEKHRQEIRDIRNNIRDLEQQLYKGQNVNPRSQKESERILKGFRQEQQLRETKISFYETCRAKLENIVYNQQLAQQLAEKQEKLNQLQEEHHEDLARMEQLRSEVAYEKDFLESIGQLSLRMADSNSLDKAEELQLELHAITMDLKKGGR